MYAKFSTYQLLEMVLDFEDWLAGNMATVYSRDYVHNSLSAIEAELDTRQPVEQFRMLLGVTGVPVGFEPIMEGE